MRQYHSLTVSVVTAETMDSVRVAIDVPDELRSAFEFLPGQHLPIEAIIAEQKVRRTYSIFSVPGQWPLEIGIRRQEGGVFSTYAAEELKAGDDLRVMPPFGRFHANIDPAASRVVCAFAAGSGITPIMSIVRTTLENEPASRCILFYGNRQQQSTMFIDDLFALKNRFPDRLQLNFLYSREEQEFSILSGRLDGDKVRELHQHFMANLNPTDVFVCGPDTMIDAVTTSLIALGIDETSIHSERFGSATKRTSSEAVPEPAAATEKRAQIAVIMDGHRKTFEMPMEGVSIVNAAAEQGVELPFSCKAGVCATCRTHVQEGEVRMEMNFGLEPWEVEQGFVLACQSRPVTDSVVLDYDKT